MKNISIVITVIMGLILLNGCNSAGTNNKGNNGDNGGNNNTAAQKVFIDTDTKLMWEDDAYSIMVTKPMLTDENYQACNDDNTSGACADYTGDTAVTYCKEMTLEGYVDWRMPTVEELTYLYQFKHDKLKNIYIPEGMTESSNGWIHTYWAPGESDKDKNCTSTVAIENAGGTILAGSSIYSLDDCIDKSFRRYIRCVRDIK